MNTTNIHTIDTDTAAAQRFEHIVRQLMLASKNA